MPYDMPRSALRHGVVAALPVLTLTLALALTACGRSESPEQKAAARLAKAEEAMEACKKRQGLEGTATPTTMILDDPATRGQVPTPETMGQLRMKVQCALELNELLDARRGPGAK
jgi:hypothetical protein